MSAFYSDFYPDGQIAFIVKTIGYFYFPSLAYQLLINNQTDSNSAFTEKTKKSCNSKIKKQFILFHVHYTKQRNIGNEIKQAVAIALARYKINVESRREKISIYQPHTVFSLQQ